MLQFGLKIQSSNAVELHDLSSLIEIGGLRYSRSSSYFFHQLGKRRIRITPEAHRTKAFRRSPAEGALGNAWHPECDVEKRPLKQLNAQLWLVGDCSLFPKSTYWLDLCSLSLSLRSSWAGHTQRSTAARNSSNSLSYDFLVPFRIVYEDNSISSAIHPSSQETPSSLQLPPF